MAQRENYFPVAPRKFSQLHLLRLRFANRAFSRLETCSLLLFNKGTMAGGTCTGWQYTFKPPKIFRELHHVFINLPPGLLTKRGSVAIPGPPSPNTSVPCQVEQLSPIPRKAWSFNETSYPSYHKKRCQTDGQTQKNLEKDTAQHTAWDFLTVLNEGFWLVIDIHVSQLQLVIHHSNAKAIHFDQSSVTFFAWHSTRNVWRNASNGSKALEVISRQVKYIKDNGSTWLSFIFACFLGDMSYWISHSIVSWTIPAHPQLSVAHGAFIATSKVAPVTPREGDPWWRREDLGNVKTNRKWWGTYE